MMLRYADYAAAAAVTLFTPLRLAFHAVPMPAAASFRRLGRAPICFLFSLMLPPMLSPRLSAGCRDSCRCALRRMSCRHCRVVFDEFADITPPP